MAGRIWRASALAVLLGTAGSVACAAADQSFEGAWHVHVTSPHEVQASVLDGAIRRTVTFTVGQVEVLPDVPDGQPQRIEVRDLTENLLPYVKGRIARIHVTRPKDVVMSVGSKDASTEVRVSR